MTPEERGVIMATLISAMKELGEIAECLIKGDPNDHWKQELGDLCALSVQPLLDVAALEYYDACDIGWNRHRTKLLESHRIEMDNREPNVETIIKILHEHEDSISDGYEYYGGNDALKTIAEEIIEARSATGFKSVPEHKAGLVQEEE